MSPTGATRVAAVIGSPVHHSLSPALHNAAFGAAGLDWVFTAFEVAPGDGPAAVDAMRTLGLRGLAVTMPHKEAVAAAVDEIDGTADVLRSVNTVVLRDDGTTFGTSTDGAGFVASLRASGVAPSGRRVAVLGAGAAGRSIVDALRRDGAADVAVVNRTLARAEELVDRVGGARVGTADDVAAAEIVVNTTSVGMRATAGDIAGSASADELPCDSELLSDRQVVADIVYHPLETPLLRVARSVGAATVDGLGMLVHQAALQQELWTGHRPDVQIMRVAAEAELARR